MRLRWPKYLPRFPAVLLMPTVLAAWVMLWVHPMDEVSGWKWGWGSDFPLRFIVTPYDTDPVSALVNPGQAYGWSIMGVRGFLVDIFLALAAAWAPAMGLERLPIPWIRGRRRHKRATPPEPS